MLVNILKKRKKNIFLLGMFIIFSVFSFCFFAYSSVFADDLLMKAFRPAIERDMTIDLGETKTTVGHSLTREQTSMKISPQDDIQVKKKPPLLVRIAKIFLRITIMLAVTMIIYNAVVYGITVMNGEGWWSKKTIQQLVLVVGGVVLALMSIALVNLMRSLGTTSLEGIFKF